ncbi:MAG: pyruvate formate lyase family protein [Lachnospiraceae bacterium]
MRYLGGTNETYGNINVSDSLSAIKHFVYDTHEYTLQQIVDATRANFEGYELMRRRLWEYDKYGNDIPEIDDFANEFFEYVANGIRDRGIAAGMQYYLIVISNNQLNTEWGRRTGASPDGRCAGQYMNPANNPQGGASRNGPTAVLNSLARFDAGPARRLRAEYQVFHELLPREPRQDKGHVQDLFQARRLPRHGHGHRQGRAGESARQA